MYSLKLSLLLIFILIFRFPGLSYSQNYAKFNNAVELSNAKNYNDAIKIFEGLISEDPESHQALFQIGKISFLKEEYKEAVKYLEKAVKLNETSSEYYGYLGISRANFAIKGSKFKFVFRARKAVNELNKAIELDPYNLDARVWIIPYYTNAPKLFGGGVDKALDQAKYISRYDHLKGARSYVEIYDTKKRYKDSEELLLKRIEEYPSEEEYKILLGRTYYSMKIYDKAFELFEIAIAADPENINSYYNIGRTAAKAGNKLDRGIECLREYLKTNDIKYKHWAHQLLGEIYVLKGDKENARKEFTAALAIKPDLKEAKEGLKKVK